MRPFTFIAAAIGLALGVSAAEPRIEHKQPGDSLPDVALGTADGSTLDLHEAVSEQPAVIAFYRGGWCPYCSKHLAELGRVEAQLRELGYQILAVSPDRPVKMRESLQQLADVSPEEMPAYTLLSDSQMEAAKAFGIAFEVEPDVVRQYAEYGIDLVEASGENHQMLPHPAIFVVSSDKVIRFAHVDPDYKTRLTGEAIVEAAKKAQKP